MNGWVIFCNNWHAFLLANVPCTEKQVSPSHLRQPYNSLPSLFFLTLSNPPLSAPTSPGEESPFQL